MMVGVNAHPQHSDVKVGDLERFELVRYPTWLSKSVKRYKSFGDKCLEVGIDPVIVCDKRTLGVRTKNYYTAFQRLLARYPDVTYWQIGNEADQKGSESSWYMAPGEYRELLKIAEDVLSVDGTRIMLSSGMVSGDPHYLEEVGYFPFDRLAIHPYGQFPVRKNPVWSGWGFGDVCDLLENYVRVLGAEWKSKIWVTEFGMPTSAFGSVAQRQLYYEDMLVEMSDWGVEAALPYCWSEEQCGELSLCGKVNI